MSSIDGSAPSPLFEADSVGDAPAADRAPSTPEPPRPPVAPGSFTPRGGSGELEASALRQSVSERLDGPSDEAIGRNRALSLQTRVFLLSMQLCTAARRGSDEARDWSRALETDASEVLARWREIDSPPTPGQADAVAEVFRDAARAAPPSPDARRAGPDLGPPFADLASRVGAGAPPSLVGAAVSAAADSLAGLDRADRERALDGFSGAFAPVGQAVGGLVGAVVGAREGDPETSARGLEQFAQAAPFIQPPERPGELLAAVAETTPSLTQHPLLAPFEAARSTLEVLPSVAEFATRCPSAPAYLERLMTAARTGPDAVEGLLARARADADLAAGHLRALTAIVQQVARDAGRSTNPFAALFA